MSERPNVKPASWYFDHPGGKAFHYDVARGSYRDIKTVNKFGRTINADSGIVTDIWDGANPTQDVDLWPAPTAARVHAITSSDANDTAAGTGARKIRLYGLQSWDTPESYEDITMAGAGAVNTSNSYVIIHRIKVTSSGASGPNIGNIFATAAVDGTVTAMIRAGEGQTQMAVYGVPSTQVAYMVQFYASLNKAVASAVGNVSLVATIDVKNQTGVFQIKHTLGFNTAGTSAFIHHYSPFNAFSGPVILKLQVTTGQNDCDVSGGFDLILEDK